MARIRRGGRVPRYGKAFSTTLLGEPATKACGKVGGKQNVEVCVVRPRGQGPVVDTPQAACKILDALRGRDRESFVTISLDAQSRVLGVEELARGTVNGVDVHPREVFKAPIVLGAVAVIIAHNHPSGSTAPSAEDVDLTRRLKVVGDQVGIPVMDHVIVAGERGCVSVMESGLAGKKR